MIFVLLRIAIGCLFIVSGFSKLIEPYQNFGFVIESYKIVSGDTAALLAHVLPWVELICGAFLVAGLWLKASLRVGWGFFVVFILVVSQALVRHLPIRECGCFGEFISLPLSTVVLIDSFFLILTAILIAGLDKTSRFSLDKFYAKKK